MNRIESRIGRVLWLPAAVLLIIVTAWLMGAGRQGAVSADEPPSIYLSSNTTVTINGTKYPDEDIFVLNTATGQWQRFLDGSALGLGAMDIDAFEIEPDGALLLSIDANTTTFPDVGVVKDSDIVRFVPSSPGNYGAGSFAMYVDGDDVGLTTSAEDIDAIAIAPNGDLLISTLGTAKVPNGGGGTITARDADLTRLRLTSTGNDTTGTWQPYFDGSDVKLTTTYEDISGAWLDPASGNLLLSTFKSFNVGSLTGKGSDIFICGSFTSGSNTSCNFGTSLFWQGSSNGIGTKLIDGLAIAGDVAVPPPPAATATSTPPAASPTATPPSGPNPTPTATPRPGNPPNTEMLIYDWNKDVRLQDKGMPRDRPPMASANGDWTQPRNFAQGTLHFRVEFFSMPVAHEMQTQFCVWQDNWAREQCAARSGVFWGRNGTIVTWSSTIQSMWKLPGSVPIDWTRERMIWGYVLRTKEGKPIHPKFDWSGINTDQWFPMKWRATAVVVEKGATFSGWNNYIP